jgi:acetolactate synthase-1/2/3 large subunit
MHLIDAVGKNPRLTAVACLHEQACSISAEAYARINGNLGVAMVTTGPGATNAVTGVAGAWIESAPLLVISGQVKRSDMMAGAPLRQKGVQEVDIVSIVGPITKYAVTVKEPEGIRRELEKAVHIARSGRGGPVWIDVPLDVQGAPIDPKSLQGLDTAPDAPSSTTTDRIERVIDLIAGAERPLILAGHGVRLAGASQLFKRTAEALGIPVVTTWNALDLLPYDHPLLVGRPGVVALRAPNFAVQNCDLLISIGSRLDNIITAYDPRGFARCAKKVVVDADRNEFDKLDFPIEVKLEADAKTFLETILRRAEGIAPLDFRKWREVCRDWKNRYQIRSETGFPASGRIGHFQAADALSELIPPDTLISTGSSGLAIEAFYTVFRNRPGQRIFLTSGLGAMGYGVPAAVGACFANGRKPMVAVESDGSLQLNIQELATIRAFNLPICLIVLNNAGYASIRNTQRNYFSGRYVGTGPEAGLWLPDLEDVARSYHLPFRRISDAGELVTALEEVLAEPRPILVDVQLTADETLAPKVAAMPQPDGSIISMPMEDMSPLLPLELLEREMIIPLTEASINCRR